jgi:hypothetical protein
MVCGVVEKESGANQGEDSSPEIGEDYANGGGDPCALPRFGLLMISLSIFRFVI